MSLRDINPEVKEEYLEKLRAIEKTKGKIFDNKEDFLGYLENEI